MQYIFKPYQYINNTSFLNLIKQYNSDCWLKELCSCC